MIEIIAVGLNTFTKNVTLAFTTSLSSLFKFCCCDMLVDDDVKVDFLFLVERRLSLLTNSYYQSTYINKALIS